MRMKRNTTVRSLKSMPRRRRRENARRSINGYGKYWIGDALINPTNEPCWATKTEQGQCIRKSQPIVCLHDIN
jgi:hypothetical protein